MNAHRYGEAIGLGLLIGSWTVALLVLLVA
jgi:hypothetical protein